MAAQLSKPRKQVKTRKINQEEVIRLREKGLTITDIAKHQNVSPSGIYRFLEKIKPEQQALERFKGNIADYQLQAMMECQELGHLVRRHLIDTFPEICKSNDVRLIKELAVMAEGGKHYNFLDWRLSTDQSTENQAVLVSAIHDLKSRKRLRNGEEVAVINREGVETGDCAL